MTPGVGLARIVGRRAPAPAFCVRPPAPPSRRHTPIDDGATCWVPACLAVPAVRGRGGRRRVPPEDVWVRAASVGDGRRGPYPLRGFARGGRTGHARPGGRGVFRSSNTRLVSAFDGSRLRRRRRGTSQ